MTGDDVRCYALQILRLCEEWEVSPASVLVVGDSPEDMSWGFLAGCRTCLIEIGAHHADETRSAGMTHFSIDNLHELRELVLER